MNTTTVCTRLALLTLLVFAVSGAASPALACVVGAGTGASCTEAELDACLPGGGSFDGAVTFACGGAATITVTGPKTISTDTTIDGGSVITISGGGTVQVFAVNSGKTFTVENLTIANGTGISGAAIANDGTVTATNSTFSGNSSSSNGGAIANTVSGSVTVTDSTFSGNHSGSDGGAISSVGTVIVSNSTFSDNSASNGGGAIFNNLTLTVTNSTFSGNSASSGGAIFNSGPPTMLNVINCTFSGNSAPLGGGAIGTFSGTVTVVNSMLANSTSGGDCGVSAVATITDGGHNIDDGTTCGFTGAGCATTTGTSFCNTNALLDPAGLASNGGPTQTIALESGSPAIDAGDQTVCAAPPVNGLDQREAVRPGAGATNCSIGAYEFNAARCGDVNGDGAVNIADALLVAQFDVGLRQCGLTPFSHPEVCDVNGDGACNIGDALRMAQCDVGLVSCAFTCRPFVCPLTWFYTCGDPVCGGHTPHPGVPPCNPGDVAGAPCTPKGATCDPGDFCNRLLVCATSDPRHGGMCPI